MVLMESKQIVLEIILASKAISVKQVAKKVNSNFSLPG